MRWDELFADLEGQLEAGLGAEERDREAEEERLRLGRLSLRDRIAGVGSSDEPFLRIELLTGEAIALRPRTVGRDWVAGDLPGNAQGVLPLSAVAALLPTATQVAASLRPVSHGSLTDRLGLPFVLRDLARRRRGVEVVTRRGVLTGTLDRVGRDSVDLAAHAADDWRRSAAIAGIRVLALAEVLLVRVR
jgi:hypothetical protein